MGTATIVFDAETGKYKRHWGAYGHKPDDTDLGNYNPDAPPAQQFRNPVHCADLSVDRLLYVCDRVNDRIHILLRDTLEVLTTFGEGGRQPGEFYGPHSIATDSKGNIYVTETYRGQRVQKFVYKGLGPVTKEDQGVLWPKTTKK